MAQNTENLNVRISLNDKLSKPLRVVTGQIRGLSDQINSATQRMQTGFLLGAGAVLGLVGALKPAFAFEAAIGRIAVTGEDATEVLTGMRESALRLNARFGAGAAEMVGSLDQARRILGVTGDELERATGNAELLSRQFAGIDRAGVFAAQAALMREYKLNVADASDAIGFLLRQGGDLKGELLESLLEYSVQFKALGFDVRQQIGVTQAALDRGWNVDKMLDAVKEGGLKIREMQKDQVNALTGLGLDALIPQIRAGEIKVSEVMRRIGAKVAGLDNKTEQFNVLQKLFGTPAEDVGIDGMLAMLGAIGDSPKVKGAMAQLTNLWQQSPEALFSRLKGQAQNLSTSIGSLLLPVLLPLMEQFTSGLKTLRGWAEIYPNITKLVALGTLAFFGLGLALGVAKFLFGALGLAMVPFRAAMMLAVGAVKLLSLAFATSPIGLLAIGLGVAAFFVVRHWETLKSWFGSFWDWLVDKAKIVGGAIAGFLEAPAAALAAIGGAIGSFFGVGSTEKSTVPASRQPVGSTQKLQSIPGAGKAMQNFANGNRGGNSYEMNVTVEKMDPGQFQRLWAIPAGA